MWMRHWRRQNEKKSFDEATVKTKKKNKQINHKAKLTASALRFDEFIYRHFDCCRKWICFVDEIKYFFPLRKCWFFIKMTIFFLRANTPTSHFLVAQLATKKKCVLSEASLKDLVLVIVAPPIRCTQTQPLRGNTPEPAIMGRHRTACRRLDEWPPLAVFNAARSKHALSM